jgi:hypothetical protein
VYCCSLLFEKVSTGKIIQIRCSHHVSSPISSMLLFCNYPILISVTISVSLAENEKRYPPRLLLSSRSWAAIQTVTVHCGFWPLKRARLSWVFPAFLRRWRCIGRRWLSSLRSELGPAFLYCQCYLLHHKNNAMSVGELMCDELGGGASPSEVSTPPSEIAGGFGCATNS